MPAKVENRQDILCAAPFINLFFGNRGRVMACCANKMYELGRYPEQSILEIWHGKRIAELRKAMLNGDYSKGCMGCKAFIDNGNTSGAPFTGYTQPGEEIKENWPQRLEFEITNTCNLECVMCTGEYSSSIRERREHKPSLYDPYDDAFIEQLEPFLPHLKSVRFVGGEPFLIARYFKVWEMIAAINPSIQIFIQTNGTILNSKVKSVLEKISASISVSIDSLNAENYPSIRVNGDLSNTLRNIQYFSDYCVRKGTNLSFSFCSMSCNWSEIPHIAYFANTYNATVFYNTVHYPVNLSLQTLSKDRLLDIITYLDTFSFPQTTSVESKNHSAFEHQKREIRTFLENAENIQHTSDDITTEVYLNRIRDYIFSQEKLSEQEKQNTYKDLEANLKLVLNIAAGDKLEFEALKGISSMSNAIVVQHLPAVTDAVAAYTELKERVLSTLNRKGN